MAMLALSKSAPRQEIDVDLTAGTVVDAPKTWLRLEGLGVLALSVMAYSHTGGGWALFAILFLVPDLSMLGYLFGPRVGAFLYNLGHSYLLPAALGAAGFLIGAPLLTSGALIWVSHIGFDRLVGYGLKYDDAFKHTHLGLPFARRAQAFTAES